MQYELINVIVSFLQSVIESKNIWKLIRKRTLQKISSARHSVCRHL